MVPVHAWTGMHRSVPFWYRHCSETTEARGSRGRGRGRGKRTRKKKSQPRLLMLATDARHHVWGCGKCRFRSRSAFFSFFPFILLLLLDRTERAKKKGIRRIEWIKLPLMLTVEAADASFKCSGRFSALYHLVPEPELEWTGTNRAKRPIWNSFSNLEWKYQSHKKYLFMLV